MFACISRPPSLALICVIIVAFQASAAAASQPFDAPPSGLVASSATLDQVLAGYDQAHAPARWATRTETGKVTLDGLTGTYREIESNGDSVESYDFGVIRYSTGSWNDQAWYQNPNGIVMLQHDTHQENEIAGLALARHARTHNEGLSLAGEEPAPLSAYVVEIRAAGGRHEWQFFDKRTFQLVRSELVYPTKRVVVTYDDYRTTDGVTEAWHLHRSDGHPQNDEDFVTTSERHGIPIAAADLAIPPSRDDLVQFPAGASSVKLPARIIGGRVVVRVTIGDRGYDFQLDSGASSIVVDAGLAHQLGLSTFGESVQEAGGSFRQRQALIPQMRIGDIALHDVVVDTTSFTMQEDADTKVVGLLGFDFIAGAGVKIDYAQGTVEASPPELFVPPADGQALDAVWDDGVPRIPVRLGAAQAHFIFDTGADEGMIYERFVREHPDVVSPANDGQGGSVRGTGVGGYFTLRRTQAGSLTVAGVDYQHVPMVEVINDPGFEYEDYDGLLGYQILKDFTVYIDYKDSHIYLVQNLRR